MKEYLQNILEKHFDKYFSTSGKNWNNNQLVCRACLKDWFENHREEFARLIDPKKQKIFINYRGYGVFDKLD